MTTANPAAGPTARDWKVTTGHRVMIKIGWAIAALAAYVAIAAAVVGLYRAWWVAAALAALALLIGALAPAPVPTELITGARNRIDTRRPVSPGPTERFVPPVAERH
jgi:hypothetical protein